MRVCVYVYVCARERERVTAGMRENESGMRGAEIDVCEETKWVLAYWFRDSGIQM